MDLSDFTLPDIITFLLKELEKENDVAGVLNKLRTIKGTADRISNVTESTNTGLKRSRSYYDELILKILEATRAAVAREKLLELVFDQIQGQDNHETQSNKSNSGIFLLLSCTTDANNLKIKNVRFERQTGMNARRFANLTENGNMELANSKLLKTLILNQEPIEFMNSEFMRGVVYDGEFDRFSNSKNGFWLVGIPLPSISKNHASKAIVGIYPVIGSKTQPRLPRGGKQEWRVLEFTQIAYSLLNHQLGSIAERVSTQRRILIADLAPGIVNHEINTLMTNMIGITESLEFETRSLAKDIGYREQFEGITQAIAELYDTSRKASEITDAFNNLDRRQALTKITAKKLVQDVLSITKYRTNEKSIRVVPLFPDDDFEMITDSALVIHAVLNVVLNAIDACTEVGGDRIIAIQVALQGSSMVEIIIANNGPPVSKTTIFEKGVTTKKIGVGHGQGLFICRLVAGYLGGTVDLVPKEELIKGSTVAFKFLLPKNSKRTRELIENIG